MIFFLNNITVFITDSILPVLKIAKLTFRSNTYSLSPEHLSLWGFLLPNSIEFKEFKHELAVNRLIRDWTAWKKLCPRFIKIDGKHWLWIPWLISRSPFSHIAFRQRQETPTGLKYAKDGTLNEEVEKTSENTAKSKYSGTKLSNQNYIHRRDSIAIAPAFSGLLKIQWPVQVALPVVL